MARDSFDAAVRDATIPAQARMGVRGCYGSWHSCHNHSIWPRNLGCSFVRADLLVCVVFTIKAVKYVIGR